VTLEDRGRFLLDYMALLLSEGEGEEQGFRHRAGSEAPSNLPGSRHERWVINKLRALMSWYSKGLVNGGHLRTAINSAESVSQVRDIVDSFFTSNVGLKT